MNPTENEMVADFMKIAPQEDGNWCPTQSISHKCRVASTFPLLLVHTLRLSFNKEFVVKGATPEAIAVGYQKPYNGPKTSLTFDELLELYAEVEEDANKAKYPPKKPYKKSLEEGDPQYYNTPKVE